MGEGRADPQRGVDDTIKHLPKLYIFFKIGFRLSNRLSQWHNFAQNRVKFKR